MRRVARRERGITIVEQIVGLMVTAIILALGLPNYTDYLQNRHVRTNAESIVDALHLTRLEAVRRNEAVDFRLNGNDWSIVVPSTNERVQARTNAESRNARVTFPGGPTIAVTFNGLGRITSGNANTIFTVTHATGTCAPAGPYRCFQVHMSAGGQVRMCDPQLPSGDPQACS